MLMLVPDLQIELRSVEALVADKRNAREHPPAQIAQLAASIREFGFIVPVLCDDTGKLMAGHGRVMAAKEVGLQKIPTIEVRHLTDLQKRGFLITDNRLAENSDWNKEMLAAELLGLKQFNFDLAITGFSAAEIDKLTQWNPAEDQAAKLADRFMIPPFSVFNAREGWWQDRKRAWIALGIRSELGRGENTLGFSEVCNSGGYAGLEKKRRSIQSGSAVLPIGGDLVQGMRAAGRKYAQTYDAGAPGDLRASYRAVHGAETERFRHPERYGEAGMAFDGGAMPADVHVPLNGTSIFDPVLCEIAYRWFCPPAGLVLDPFAGGSVRGIVAAKLGRRYVGQELRREQVFANREQAHAICAGAEYPPQWIEGDSRGIDQTCAGIEADFLFTCPPYADLERYSDDPLDISTYQYPRFREAYFEIIAKACGRLRADRFACVVVGEVRDKQGEYYDFVGDTVEAFRRAGLAYYNEAILVTAIGSLPIRVGKQFEASRKLGKTHQNVLVFCKGDPRAAVVACGAVDVADALAAVAVEDEAPPLMEISENARRTEAEAEPAQIP
jgi:hypothetical protein